MYYLNPPPLLSYVRPAGAASRNYYRKFPPNKSWRTPTALLTWTGLCRSLDFTSVNSFQEDVKFSSPSLYNLTPPPPPASRPPPYELTTNFGATLSKSLSLGNAPTQPLENYYAATDIIKVRHPPGPKVYQWITNILQEKQTSRVKNSDRIERKFLLYLLFIFLLSTPVAFLIE